MDTPHVTVITHRSGRGIASRYTGERVNLCGAALTDRDIILRDFRRLGPAAVTAWRICGACIDRARTLPAPGRRTTP